MRISVLDRGPASKTFPNKIFDGSFEELASIFEECNYGREKADGWFVRGELKGERNDANLISISLLMLDGDRNTDNPQSASEPEVIHNYLKYRKINHFIYTTYSHDPENGVYKWRCIIPCSMEQAQLKPTVAKIIGELNESEIPLVNVKENWAASQCWFMPNRKEEDGHFSFYSYFDGVDYVPADGEVELPSAIAPAPAKSTQVVPAANSQESTGTVRGDGELIRQGVTFHYPLRNMAWGFIKDGVAPDTVAFLLETQMQASLAAHSDHHRHEDWKQRLKIIPEIVRQTVKKQADEEVVDVTEFSTDTGLEDDPYPWPGTPGDLVYDYFQGIYDCMHYPSRTLAVAIGYGILAGICGRAWNINGAGLNFYFALLADSGEGKGDITRIMNTTFSSLLNGMGTRHYYGSAFTGPKPLYRRLNANRSLINVFDEAGPMSAIKSGDQAGLRKAWLLAYPESGVSGFLSGIDYSDGKESLPGIPSPAYSMMDVSTPSSYLRGMNDREAMLSGEVGRMLIMRVDDFSTKINRSKQSKLPPHIIDRLESLAKHAANFQGDGPTGPVTEILDGDDIRREKLFDLSDHYRALKKEHEQNSEILQAAFCSRAALKIAKLSALLHVFAGTEKISDAHWDYNIQLMEREFKFVETTFAVEADAGLSTIVEAKAIPQIVKMMKGEFKNPQANPSLKLKNAGCFTMSQFIQASGTKYRDIDDSGSQRSSPREGAEKILEYMVRLGYLTKLDKAQQKILVPKAKAYSHTFKITPELKLSLELKSQKREE